jgi:tetratricopeptide (TPR) repeat protein
VRVDEGNIGDGLLGGDGNGDGDGDDDRGGWGMEDLMDPESQLQSDRTSIEALRTLPRSRQIAITSVWLLNYESSGLVEPARQLFDAIGCLRLTSIPDILMNALASTLATLSSFGGGDSHGDGSGADATGSQNPVDTTETELLHKVLVDQFRLVNLHGSDGGEAPWYSTHALTVHIAQRYRSHTNFRKGVAMALTALHGLVKKWATCNVAAAEGQALDDFVSMYQLVPHLDKVCALMYNLVDLTGVETRLLVECHLAAANMNARLGAAHTAKHHYQSAAALVQRDGEEGHEKAGDAGLVAVCLARASELMVAVGHREEALKVAAAALALGGGEALATAPHGSAAYAATVGLVRCKLLLWSGEVADAEEKLGGLVAGASRSCGDGVSGVATGGGGRPAADASTLHQLRLAHLQAEIHIRRGRHSAAVAVLQRTAATLRHRLETGGIVTTTDSTPLDDLLLDGVHRLVDTLDYLGKYTEVGELTSMLERLAPVKTAPYCPMWVMSLQWIGHSRWRRGDYPFALDALLAALQLHQEAYGQETHHPAALRTLLLLGAVYVSNQNYEQGLSQLNLAVTAAHRIYGASAANIHFGTVLLWVGRLFIEEGDFEAAHGQLTRAIEKLRASTEPSRHVEAGANDHVARAAAGRGDLAVAGDAAHNSLRTRQELYSSDPSHPEIALSLYGLGIVCRLQGDMDKALQHLNAALAIQTTCFGAGSTHPLIVSSIAAISEVHCAKDEFEKAATLCDHALAMSESRFGGSIGVGTTSRASATRASSRVHPEILRLRALRQAIQNGESVVKKTPISRSMWPRLRPPHFLGREAELDELYRKLNDDELAYDLIPGRAVVSSEIAGVGKTALLLHYCWDNRHSYVNGVFWLDARSVALLRWSAVETLVQLGIDYSGEFCTHQEVANALFAALERRGTNWLLCFDGMADDSVLDVFKLAYMLEGELRQISGHVVVTSSMCSPDKWQTVQMGKPLMLEKLSDEDASLLLLRGSRGIARITRSALRAKVEGLPTKERRSLQKVASRSRHGLRGHPLAISQGAAYVFGDGMKCGSFVDFRHEVKEMLREPLETMSVAASAALAVVPPAVGVSVYFGWTELSGFSQDVLSAIACLHSLDIPRVLLERICTGMVRGVSLVEDCVGSVASPTPATATPSNEPHLSEYEPAPEAGMEAKMIAERVAMSDQPSVFVDDVLDELVRGTGLVSWTNRDAIGAVGQNLLMLHPLVSRAVIAFAKCDPKLFSVGLGHAAAALQHVIPTVMGQLQIEIGQQTPTLALWRHAKSVSDHAVTVANEQLEPSAFGPLGTVALAASWASHYVGDRPGVVQYAKQALRYFREARSSLASLSTRGAPVAVATEELANAIQNIQHGVASANYVLATNSFAARAFSAANDYLRHGLSAVQGIEGINKVDMLKAELMVAAVIVSKASAECGVLLESGSGTLVDRLFDARALVPSDAGEDQRAITVLIFAVDYWLAVCALYESQDFGCAMEFAKCSLNSLRATGGTSNRMKGLVDTVSESDVLDILGAAQLLAARNPQALRSFEQARDVRLAQNGNAGRGISTCKSGCNMAETLARMGRWDQALSTLQTCLSQLKVSALHSTSPECMEVEARVHFLMGDLFYISARFDAAFQHHQKALDLRLSSPTPHNLLGRLDSMEAVAELTGRSTGFESAAEFLDEAQKLRNRLFEVRRFPAANSISQHRQRTGCVMIESGRISGGMTVLLTHTNSAPATSDAPSAFTGRVPEPGSGCGAGVGECDGGDGSDRICREAARANDGTVPTPNPNPSSFWTVQPPIRKMEPIMLCIARCYIALEQPEKALVVARRGLVELIKTCSTLQMVVTVDSRRVAELLRTYDVDVDCVSVADSFLVGLAMETIGDAHVAAGDSEAALDWTSAALDMLYRLFGEGCRHPRVGICLLKVGSALCSDGDEIRGLQRLREGKAMLQKVYGKLPQIPAVARMYVILGEEALENADNLVALNYVQQAAMIAQQPKNKCSTLFCALAHERAGTALDGIGNYVASVAQYRICLELRRTYLLQMQQTGDRDSGSDISLLARCRVHQLAAVPELVVENVSRGCATALVGVFGSQSGAANDSTIVTSTPANGATPSAAASEMVGGRNRHGAINVRIGVIQSLLHIGVALSNCDKSSEAIASLESAKAAWAELRESEKAARPDLEPAILSGLSLAWQASGELGRATGFQVQSLASLAKIHGPNVDHPDVAFALHGFAVLLERCGRAQAAMEQCTMSLDIMGRLGFDELHPGVITMKQLLGRFANGSTDADSDSV